MQQPSHSLLKLHLAVFVAGLTGLFGKLVSLSEMSLVWWRLILTLIIFIPVMHYKHLLKPIPWREMMKMGAVGALLGIHWVLFYTSIRLSNVSVGVVCLALIGFYTAVLSPIINKSRFKLREILFSTLSLAGLLLIFHFDTQFRLGIIVGTISSLFATLFTVLNKYLQKRLDHDIPTFLLYEIGGGWICLCLLMPLYLAFLPGAGNSTLLPDWHDLMWLIVLASLCTVGQYLLQLDALRGVSSFTVNLTYTLEPVYSIILAATLFGEYKEMTAAFICGIAVIVASVLLQNVYQRNKD